MAPRYIQWAIPRVSYQIKGKTALVHKRVKGGVIQQILMKRKKKTSKYDQEMTQSNVNLWHHKKEKQTKKSKVVHAKERI